jgi:hypothetical protein
MAQQVVTRARSSVKGAANWLSKAAANLPFGDIVSAQTLVDSALKEEAIPFNVVSELMEREPHEERPKDGDQALTHIPGVGILNLTFRAQGISTRMPLGEERLFAFDTEQDEAIMYADVHGWLILSHLAGIPFAALNKKNGELQRADPFILLEVGKCPFVLRRPAAELRMNEIPTHEIPEHGSIVCHKVGIIEPITLSIFNFLRREEEYAEHWVKEAASSGNVFLLARLNIALLELTQGAEPALAAFAVKALTDLVGPALSASILSSIHCE